MGNCHLGSRPWENSDSTRKNSVYPFGGEMSVKLKPHGSLFKIRNIPLHNHNLRKQNSVPIYSRENGEVKKIDHVFKDY